MTVEPGIADPDGETPVTVPARAPDAVVTELTVKPDACNLDVAADWLRPTTSGTWPFCDPRAYFSSIGGSEVGPKLLATGFIAANQDLAGSVPP